MTSSRATSFGAWADEYDVWRPTYPDAAVDWLLPQAGSRVAEVGAGKVAGVSAVPLAHDAVCVRWYPGPAQPELAR